MTHEVEGQYPDEKLNKEIEILKIPPSLTRFKKKRRNLKVCKKILPNTNLFSTMQRRWRNPRKDFEEDGFGLFRERPPPAVPRDLKEC